MSKILVGVPYVEGEDVNGDGSLKKYVGKGKPIVMLVYGSFCPHCTRVMPTFEQLAKSLPDVQCVAVQSDGGPSDKQAYQMISQIAPMQGVPSFLKFSPDGRYMGMHSGGRDMASLRQFAMS